MAESAHSTATLRLTMGDLRIVHPITVPNAAVPAAEVVPALFLDSSGLISKRRFTPSLLLRDFMLSPSHSTSKPPCTSSEPLLPDTTGTLSCKPLEKKPKPLLPSGPS